MLHSRSAGVCPRPANVFRPGWGEVDHVIRVLKYRLRVVGIININVPFCRIRQIKAEQHMVPSRIGNRRRLNRENRLVARVPSREKDSFGGCALNYETGGGR